MTSDLGRSIRHLIFLKGLFYLATAAVRIFFFGCIGNAITNSGWLRLRDPSQHRWVGSQGDASLSLLMPLAAAVSSSKATDGAVSLAATSSASTRSKAAATSSGLAIAAKSAVSKWVVGT